MPRIFRQDDADLGRLKDRPIAVLGYGSQGRAQALNLMDGGFDVRVGTRAGGPSSEQASRDGFIPVTLSEATSGAQALVFCLPDVAMGKLFEDQIQPRMRPDALLVFAHGFAIHYGLVHPPAEADVVLVAPMGAGPVVRERFESGSGVPALVAVHQDRSGDALPRALAYGGAIGCGRVAMLETTFREETESDLFGEQAVLCGGLPALIQSAYEAAVAGGIAPEVAYIACLHEVKLIADLIYAKGLDGMRSAISETAEWGGYRAGPVVIGEPSRSGLQELLAQIQSGQFAREWIEESRAGSPNLTAMRSAAGHPIDAIGHQMRGLFGIEPAET